MQRKISSKLITFGSILIIVFITYLAYSNSFYGQFVYDDFTSFIHKPVIRNPQNIVSIWLDNPSRFMVTLSFVLNRRFFGFSPVAAHAVNFVLHVLNAILVYMIIRVLQKARDLRGTVFTDNLLFPFITSIIFAVHPLTTSAVSYIAQRAAVMASFFLLTSLLYFCRNMILPANDKFRKGIFLTASFLFALFAYLTKENAFTLPLIVAGISTILFYKRKNKFYLPGIFLIFSFLIYSVMRFSSFSLDHEGIVQAVDLFQLPNPSSVDRFSYFLTQFPVTVTYIRLFFFPINQNLDYDFPIYSNLNHSHVLSSILFIFILILFIYPLRKRIPFIVLGILFFFAALMVESSIIPLEDVIMEHRMYFPMIGLSMAFSSVITYAWQNSRLRLFLSSGLFLIVIIFAMMTNQRNIIWNSPVSLWEDVVRKSPDKARGHFNLGGAYIQVGRKEDGLRELERSMMIDHSYGPSVTLVKKIVFGL